MSELLRETWDIEPLYPHQYGTITAHGAASRQHESFQGQTVDHLYPDCISVPKPVVKQLGMVDPSGSDICRICVRRWRR